MTNKALDLDLTGIVGKTTKKIPAKPKKTGIILPIISEGQTIPKDISLCSTEEFIGWCSTVFPFYTPKEQEVSSPRDKAKIFNTLASYINRGGFFGINKVEHLEH